ncbi:MAG: amidohydrolase family protein, partial [FCB group bacterium]|nr:amidohydrolase family protein [FCB group bacterium]
MERTLLTNARIIDPFGGQDFIENGYIAISDEVIESVGEGKYTGTDCYQVIDLNGKTVLPGMINAHTHLYSSLALGMTPPEKSPANFVG